MLWRSVVGKLWATILLLVTFVLLILTVFLVEFFENFQIEEVENNLTTTAHRIVQITKEHSNTEEVLKISSELVGDETKIVVFQNESVVYSSNEGVHSGIAYEFLENDSDFHRVFTEGKTVEKEITHPQKGEDGEKIKAIVIGMPLKLNGKQHQLFLYQSSELMEEAIGSTTKFILLAAGVAIILTTIFAFFLSTRINAPLNKMKEAAFEVARGKFDTKVPIVTQDEIGELAMAFNQMGKQLKFNMSALSQEKEHLASILSSMADGVITFNKDGTILETNPPAERFLQSWYFEKQDESNDVPAVLMTLFNQSDILDKEQIGEISLQGHDWVLIVSPLYGAGSIRGAVAILRDMTEERKTDKLRTDFIANVSHELRTPISMLQGYSEAIIDDVAGTEEDKKDMAQVIYDESLRMGRLVNDLLDLARMESGKVTLRYERIEVTGYIERIVYKFNGLAKEKGIQLYAKTASEETYWDFDHDRIEQVLTNLIDNAIRHTPTGGTVEVSQWIEERNGLVMEVKDSGTGIPEEDLAYVFERFYKADKARTRGKSGTGLGLAIAKNIMDAHAGYISVHSLVDIGTTFTFSLPRMLEENE